MKISSILQFAYRIIMSRKSRSFLVSFSILIGTAVLFVFFVFSQGVEKTMLKPIRDIASNDTLVVKNEALSFLFSKDSKLDQEVVDKIKSFNEVESVGRVLFLPFFSSIKTTIFWLTIDPPVPIFGIDGHMLEGDNGEEIDFEEKNGVIPAAISPRLIDLFNTEVAENSDDIPRLHPDVLIAKNDIEIFFGEVRPPDGQSGQKLKIIKVSPFAPSLGISIPMSTAINAAKKYRNFTDKDLYYSMLVIRVKNIDDILAVQQKIKDMGFNAKTFEEIGDEILSLTFTLKVTLIFASSLVIFISLLSLFSMISISIIEQKQTIGILRSMGTSKKSVVSIFLLEGFLLSAFGSIGGLIVGFLSSRVVDKFLLTKIPDISLKPDSFFPYSIEVFVYIFLAISILSILAAFMPAFNATKSDPLETILR